MAARAMARSALPAPGRAPGPAPLRREGGGGEGARWTAPIAPHRGDGGRGGRTGRKGRCRGDEGRLRSPAPPRHRHPCKQNRGFCLRSARSAGGGETASTPTWCRQQPMFLITLHLQLSTMTKYDKNAENNIPARSKSKIENGEKAEVAKQRVLLH